MMAAAAGHAVTSCAACGKQFAGTRKDKRTCSKKCANRYSRRQRPANDLRHDILALILGVVAPVVDRIFALWPESVKRRKRDIRWKDLGWFENPRCT
jgi:predicted nucleic acid-binding Zn ribbon protein